MTPKKYFAYARVSTVRQGQVGTSLDEQRGAIERYAERYGLHIAQLFEERETAARRGRPVFAQMLKALKQNRACGVVMHKIDRSARNLRDWAELGELMDQGIEVHFANEQLDLYTRGGRLSADIQAVVAADFIRNLKEEVRKGFYGRLKQGLMPLPAPIGYIDCGPGKPKEIDPIQGPLIRQAFELYATGKWSHLALAEEMERRGLRSRQTQRITRQGMAHILQNEFYTGIIRISTTGEVFSGIHEAIVSRALFERARAVAKGNGVDRQKQHHFLYRRMLHCDQCRHWLIAEIQKGHVYYRCQYRPCPQKTIREELVEEQLINVLKRLQFSDEENEAIREYLHTTSAETIQEQARQQAALKLQLDQIRTRLSKLTDAYLDESIEKDLYLDKKHNLLREEQAVREKLLMVERDQGEAIRKTEEFLELVNRAYLSYEKGYETEKRELIRIVFSNRSVREKSLIYKLNYPFELVVNRGVCHDGSPQRVEHRTLLALLSQLREYFIRHEMGALSTQMFLVSG